MIALAAIIGAVGGAALGLVAGCVPGLHVYNVMGLLAIPAAHYAAADGAAGVAMTAAGAAMVASYCIFSALPSVLLAAPDESAVFIVAPSQRGLMEGRGIESALTVMAGGVCGLCVLLAAMPLAGQRLASAANRILHPHFGWILWSVIAFMLLSEWPKTGGEYPAGWRRLVRGWMTPAAGLLTFFLSGFLGCLLMERPVVPPASAFHNLMPAFVGLFTLPWLLLNIACGTRIPVQKQPRPGEGVPLPILAHGFAAGFAGGAFAAFFPAVTGGVGAMLAGQALSVRDSRAFLFSQGVSRSVYLCGSLLLGFLPDYPLLRGGGSRLIASIRRPVGHADFFLALAAVAVGASLACWSAGPALRAAARLMAEFSCRGISIVSALIALLLVSAAAGWRGFLVACVGAGIGLLPIVFGSRRLNCLGVILLPIALEMSGFGPDTARFLGPLP